MSRRRDVRLTFEVGEIGEDFLRRADTDLLGKALKRARNVVLKAGGGAERRPGSNMLATLNGQSRLYSFHGRDAIEHLVFGNGRLDIYSASGTLNQSITTSCPWATADLVDLRFAVDANTVFVFHPTFMPQILTRNLAGTWSRADYTFLTGIGSNPAQPFFSDFVDIDITMTLSAYAGSGVTMTFSDDVLKTDGTHVGTRFRYLTRNEVVITAVTDARTATVTIQDALYPTVDVTVASSAGYKAGHVVEGSISQVRGLVTDTPTSTTVRVVLLEGYERFEVITAAGVDKDRLVGDEAAQEITGVSTHSTPATTSIWDEQLISAARGYPGSGLIHRRRLFLSAFPQATNVVTASAVGNFYDFSVVADPAAAINDELGDDPNAIIRHMVSAEQLILFTDRGVYYLPEGSDNVIAGDEGLTLLKVGPEGASSVEPIVASEGVLFIDEDAGRLMAVVPTGNVRRSWQLTELSEYGFHLINSPVRLAVANGLDGRSERYVFILNADGSMAVMMYRRNSETVGFAKWYRGTGTWEDINSIEDDVYLVSKIDTTYRLGQFKFSAQADDETAYTAAVTARDGDLCVVVNTLQCVASGTVGATTTGIVDALAPASGLTIGYGFERIIEPAPPYSAQGGWARRRTPRATVEVIDSGVVRVGSKVSWPFDADDDLETVGKTSTRVIRAFSLGYSAIGEAVTTIKQEANEGAQFDIRAVTLEVAT